MNCKYRSLTAGKFFFLFRWRAALALLLMACASSASATTIALWTFETSIPVDENNIGTYPHLIPPNSGVNTGNAGGTHTSAATDWSTPVGNGSANSLSSNNWEIDDYFQFSVSTLGYKDLVLSWDQARSSSTAELDNFDMRYSSTGVAGPYTTGLESYVLLGNDAIGLPVRTTWSSVTNQPVYSYTVNLASITALNNNANVVFRLVAREAGATGNSAVRVDNFLVSGVVVPEPSSFVLLGIGALGLVRRRRGS